MPDDPSLIAQGTVEKVKALRKLTGFGLRECQYAINRANGDLNIAMGLLRIRGAAVVVRSDREKWEQGKAEEFAKESPIEEYYFRLELTENEHYIVAGEIENQISKFSGIALMYYRKMKNGHIPMLREIKVVGTRGKIALFKQWMKDNGMVPEPNESGL